MRGDYSWNIESGRWTSRGETKLQFMRKIKFIYICEETCLIVPIYLAVMLLPQYGE